MPVWAAILMALGSGALVAVINKLWPTADKRLGVQADALDKEKERLMKLMTTLSSRVSELETQVGELQAGYWGMVGVASTLRTIIQSIYTQHPEINGETREIFLQISGKLDKILERKGA